MAAVENLLSKKPFDSYLPLFVSVQFSRFQTRY